jgi:hypothetical protein
MKVMSKVSLLSLLAVTTLLAQGAGAAAGHNIYGDMFETLSSSITPQSKDCRTTLDLFTDTGQISSQTFAAALGSSSAQILGDVNVPAPGVKKNSGFAFGPGVGSAVQSVDFLFADATGSGKRSAFSSFAGGGNSITGRRNAVRWECMQNKGPAYSKAGVGSTRIAWHNLGMNF